MIKTIRWLLLAALLPWLLPTAAYAQVFPASGYWWNPAEPGRGYVIEVENSTILFAGFLYSASGEATWVTSTGPMIINQYNGSLMTYTGGQTLTGAFQPSTPSASLGAVQINFTANDHATLTWPGGTVPIQRFDIVPGGSSATPPFGNPQTGWWYNPQEGGRGFAIEVQNNTVYLAGYMYDAAGNPVWYLASGPLATGTFVTVPTFTGTWQQFGGGQTLTGGFKSAGVVNANAGAVTVQFVDAGDAVMTLPNGNQIPLIRYQFATLQPGQWQPPAGATPATGNYVYLSGNNDYVVGQAVYVYTQANAELDVEQNGSSTSVYIYGDQYWLSQFNSGVGAVPLQVGFYPITFTSAYQPGSAYGSWSGEGRGCDAVSGWLAVDNIVVTNGTLAALDLRFEQHCGDDPNTLNVKVHWVAGDPTTPPGPVNPIPAGLWQPPAGQAPASGNYILLYGANVNTTVPSYYLYTPDNSSVQFDPNGIFTPSGGLINIFITQGNVGWDGTFQTMNTINQFQIGYYGGVELARAGNKTKGGIDWSSNITGACDTANGWFTVDNVSYSGTIMTALDARFGENCDLLTAPLYGKVHWVRAAPLAPQFIQPVPGNLWQPPAGATPASGNYLYVQSDPGEAVGLGKTYTYPNAALQFYLWQGGTVLEVYQPNTQALWTGNFQTIGGAPLQAGYYANLMEWLPNITTSGMSFFGNGTACDNITGWFAIDDITLVGSTVTALDLRFEQHCEGKDPALHGKIHYSQ